MVQFLLQTGLRISEAAALCMADLKLRERTGSVRVRQGKGRKEREVPLNASARQALRTYLEPRGALPPEASLFLSGRGGPMVVRSIQNLIAQNWLAGPRSPAFGSHSTRCAIPSRRIIRARTPASSWSWPACWATSRSIPPPSTPGPRSMT